MFRGDLPGVNNLPPEEVWLFSPDTFRANPDKFRFETPVDDRGLVDIDQLLTQVMSTIDPDFEWPAYLSVHHLYFERWWYNFPSAGSEADEFREIPPHKLLMSRVLENWLHKVTIPPDIPAQDVMHYRIRAWRVAKSLFENIKEVHRLEESFMLRQDDILMGRVKLPPEYNNEDVIGKAYLRDSLARQLYGIETHLEELESVPPEFRIVDPELDIIDDRAKRTDFVHTLGRVVSAQAIPVRNLVMTG